MVAALRDNAQKLGATRAEIIRTDGAAWLRADAGVYDVIFLDPPFASGFVG